MYPSSIDNSKFDEAIVEEKIRFDDDSVHHSVDHSIANVRGRRRRFSIHSKDDKQGAIFSINEKVQPEVVLPTLFKTLSHRVENELESGTLEPQHNKFADVNFHTETVDNIVRDFDTNSVTGLTSSQVDSNFKQHGYNFQSKPPSRLLKKIFMYFFGGFGALLLVGGILCIICWKPLGSPPAISNLILGLVLLVVFLAQAVFNFFQDFTTSRVMDSIHNMIPIESSVIRDGQCTQIDSKMLVPGDLVAFSAGAKIPADMRVIDSTPDLSFDRSILTGESNAISCSSKQDSPKSNYLESTCIAMQGTFCVNGSGRGVVVTIGDNTIFGLIAKMTSQPKKGLTPLQYEILRFVALTTSIIIVLIVVVIILWCAWLHKDYRDWINVPSLIVDLVSIAVAFIPEGLPIALTTCLIITASEMRKNNILCKSLSVVETLGSVSVLCFDKTGTLTKNAMVVTDCCTGLQQIELDEIDTQNPLVTQLVTIAKMCNASQLINNLAANGNATDRAIMNFAIEFSEKAKSWNKMLEVSFNSKDKYMMSLLDANDARVWANIGYDSELIDSEKEYLLSVKGAPDILLQNCGYVMESNNTIVEMTDYERDMIRQTQNNWSLDGKRVIMMCSKLIPKDSIDLEDRIEATSNLREEVKSGMVLIGMVALEDPPRECMGQVIDKLKIAGIKIVMITGDFELTGVAIAKQCGIITGSKVDSCNSLGYWPIEEDEIIRSASITGTDLYRMDEAQWENLLEYDEIVFTRTTPEQKLLIIKQFQKYGQIIGMTGDGINDAPSLKQADVGISLLGASDIAQEASDLILMDQDDDHMFESIIEALKYGRLVFENLRKTVGYLLPAGTYAELWPVLLNVIFGMPQMLSSFLMIIICCITDCVGAVNLAYEKSESNLLTKKPRSITKERLVDFKLLLHSYFVIGTFYSFTSMMLAFLNLTRHGYKFSEFSLSYKLPDDKITQLVNISSSIYFVNLVFMQWFNLMAMRTRYVSIFHHSPLENVRLFMTIPIGLAVMFILNYIPAIQLALGTSQVPVEYYFISLGFGLVVLIYDESRKWAARKYPKGMIARMSW